jgi:hypothetical protein
MIKISAKGIAKFMVSLDATRRRILFDFKHPDPEGELKLAIIVTQSMR